MQVRNHCWRVTSTESGLKNGREYRCDHCGVTYRDDQRDRAPACVRREEKSTVEIFVTMAAKSVLARTRVAPLMYASTKEAFVSRVATLLEVAGVMDIQDFYRAHIGGGLSAPNSFNLLEAPTEEWAQAVIADAFEKLNA